MPAIVRTSWTAFLLVLATGSARAAPDTPTTLEDLAQTALAQADGNQSAAARLLGITPQAVHRFVREEGTG